MRQRRLCNWDRWVFTLVRQPHKTPNSPRSLQILDGVGIETVTAPFRRGAGGGRARAQFQAARAQHAVEPQPEWPAGRFGGLLLRQLLVTRRALRTLRALLLHSFARYNTPRKLKSSQNFKYKTRGSHTFTDAASETRLRAKPRRWCLFSETAITKISEFKWTPTKHTHTLLRRSSQNCIY